MPLLISKNKTPKGRDYAHISCSGEITAGDAASMNKSIAAGGPLHGLPIVGVVDPGANFSPEARQVFTQGATQQTPIAIVVTSAPLRVMLSFIVRISGSAANTRFCSTEAEALGSIDERAATTA